MMRTAIVSFMSVCAVTACGSSIDAGGARASDGGALDAHDDDASAVDGGPDASGGSDSGGGADGGVADANDAATPGDLVMYSDGVVDSTDWPASDDYSYGGTDDYTDSSHPESGHTHDLSLTGQYAGWQQASDWPLPYQGGRNGVDLSPYTQLKFDVYLSNDDDLNGISAHYTRSTGDDVATCTGVTDVQSLTGSLSSGAWHTEIRVPLCFLGMLSSYNTYKFAIQQKTGPTYFDNVEFVGGTTGWVVRGSSTIESGWVDASTTLTASYAWVPQSLNPGGSFDANATTGLFAINSPARAAEFTGSLSGTTLTVAAVTAGAVEVGAYLFGSGVAASTKIVSGSGTTWTVSASSGTVGAEAMTASFTQAQVDGLSLSGSGTWRANSTGGFALAPYDHFTFGAIPTASGYTYSVRFYDASGAAVGNAVEAAGSAYTPNDYGVQNDNFTVYSIPLSAFGSLGSTVGGVSITVNQKTYLSAVGFWK